MKHLLVSILLTAVVISTTNAINITADTVEKIVAYGDDDAEVKDGDDCLDRGGSSLDIEYSGDGKPNHVIITFRDIPKYKNRSLTHAHIELQTSSGSTGDMTTAIHYQSKMINPNGCGTSGTPNPIPVQSTTNLLWEMPLTEIGEIVETPNINYLLNENFQSEVWNLTNQVTLIISPITRPASPAKRHYASIEKSISDSTYKPPKLVLRYSDLSYPMKQCWTNINLKGYVIINHVSAVEQVTSVIKCCKLCSEMGDSCQSITLKQPPSTGGEHRMFSCQINYITKDESDRDHCFTKKSQAYQHYHVGV